MTFSLFFFLKLSSKLQTILTTVFEAKSFELKNVQILSCLLKRMWSFRLDPHEMFFLNSCLFGWTRKQSYLWSCCYVLRYLFFANKHIFWCSQVEPLSTRLFRVDITWILNPEYWGLFVLPAYSELSLGRSLELGENSEGDTSGWRRARSIVLPQFLSLFDSRPIYSVHFLAGDKGNLIRNVMRSVSYFAGNPAKSRISPCDISYPPMVEKGEWVCKYVPHRKTFSLTSVLFREN